jgi:hypothetical protein
MINRTVFDIGDTVICDFCGKDYTDSDAVGGMLFSSNGVCPDCIPGFEGKVKKYHEEQYIRARAKPDETFKHFVLRIRGGNNKVIIDKE